MNKELYKSGLKRSERDFKWFESQINKFYELESESFNEHLVNVELPIQRYIKDFINVYEIALHRRIHLNLDSMVTCFLEEMQANYFEFLNCLSNDDMKNDFHLFASSTARFFIISISLTRIRDYINEETGYISIEEMQKQLDLRIKERREMQCLLEYQIKKNILETIPKERLKAIKKHGHLN